MRMWSLRNVSGPTSEDNWASRETIVNSSDLGNELGGREVGEPSLGTVRSS